MPCFRQAARNNKREIATIKAVEPNSNNNAGGLIDYRMGAIVCFYSLISYFAVSTYLALPTPSVSSLIIWLIQITPLLIFAPGLHFNIIRSNIWLSFICLIYFIHGVLVAFDPGRTAMGVIETSLCIGLFSCLALLVKRHQDYKRA